ncbi:NADPH oxidase [Melampsora americana]|nr:NADPH oxidase [Melampsora americana]
MSIRTHLFKPMNSFLKSQFLNPKKFQFILLFWSTHLILFSLGFYLQISNPKLSILNLLRFSVWISRGAGLVLGLDGFLIFLPVCRNLLRLIRPKLVWLLPLDENLWFHKQVAYSTLLFTIIHTTAHYVNMLMVEKTQVREESAFMIMYTQPGPFTGHLMLLIMVLMYTTAQSKIKHQCFEAFWYTHHLAFFWAIGLYTHATGCFVRGGLAGEKVECLGYNTYRFTLISGVLYFFERVYREIRSRSQSTQIQSVLIHPSGTIELRMKKVGFQYLPGQWVFLQIPELSRFQWHPFTISSAPDDPFVSVHIRQMGDFTQALGQRLGATDELVNRLNLEVKNGIDGQDARYEDFIEITPNLRLELPLIRVDGPYGAPAEDVFKSDMAVLIGTGIGVTPFSSILKNIYYMQQKGKLGVLRKVHFIWINKDIGAFGWFRSLLQNLENIQTDPNFLTMEMYLTSKLNEDCIQNVYLNDVAHPYDPLTGLKSHTHFGRPNWNQIFNDLQLTCSQFPGREASLKTNVGVFYCGPNALSKVLKTQCDRITSRETRFNFQKEHF